MSDETKLKTLHAAGRRPNIAEEPSLFLPHEDTPAETKQKAAAKAVQTRKSAKALTVVGAALVWIPILFSLAYTIFLLTKGTQGAVVYGFVVLSLFWVLYIAGTILLYLAARKLGFLRRAIGAIAIAWAVVQGISALLTSLYGSAAGFAAQIQPLWVAAVVSFGLTGVWYACLAAIAVFAVLLLVRAFSKKNAD